MPAQGQMNLFDDFGVPLGDKKADKKIDTKVDEGVQNKTRQAKVPNGEPPIPKPVDKAQEVAKKRIKQRSKRISNLDKKTAEKKRKEEKQDEMKIAIPATELMKKVAAASFDESKAKKAFSHDEIREILDRMELGATPSDEERLALKAEVRKNKRWIKENTVGEYGKLYFYPTYSEGGIDWYRAVDFSALYYAYRLADKMLRTAHVAADNDKFVKCRYAVPLRDMDRFVEQFVRIDGGTVEVTDTGIYICTLKKPLTHEEYGELMYIEEARRERMHNVLRPASMDQATYQLVLKMIAEFIPRLSRLEKRTHLVIGERMAGMVWYIVQTYFDFTDRRIDKKTAGGALIHALNGVKAGLVLLSETGVWEFPTCTAMGESLTDLRRRIIKEFKPEGLE